VRGRTVSSQTEGYRRKAGEIILAITDSRKQDIGGYEKSLSEMNVAIIVKLSITSVLALVGSRMKI